MLRSLIAALDLRAHAPARELRTPRMTSTVTDGRISAEREAELVQAGRKAVTDRLSRSHVKRDGHFDVPRFSA